MIRASDKLQLSDNEEYVRTLTTPELWPLKDEVSSGIPPPPTVQRVAAMSNLHLDAPVFIPGQPFQVRSVATEAVDAAQMAAQGKFKS